MLDRVRQAIQGPSAPRAEELSQARPAAELPPIIEEVRASAKKHALFDPSMEAAKLVPRYREFLEAWYAELRKRHHGGEGGRENARSRALVMDAVVEYLFQQAVARFARKEGALPCTVASLALGGYGREELSPFSDIDLMFLFPDRVSGEKVEHLQAALAEGILYPLWDLGLKVGHATRTARESLAEAKVEVQSKNALLESRFIIGSHALFDRFWQKLWKLLRRENLETYLAERMADQRERHERFGNTVYLQEPDIKNGVGGLRDYHNIVWITRLKLDIANIDGLVRNHYLLPEEAHQFKEAYGHLLRVRHELHFQSPRATDLLDLEKQPKVALALGYTEEAIFARVERFMREYYTAAKRIHALTDYLQERLALNERTRVSFRAVLESRTATQTRRLDGFEVRGGTLYAESEKVFEEDPERLIRVFRHAQQLGVDFDFSLRRLIAANAGRIDERLRQSPSANKSFRAILQTSGNVYPALLAMHEGGVLAQFLPCWQGLECLVQHEYYHRYTADIHTLNTIQELDAIFNGKDPDLTGKYKGALHETRAPALLYLILLLHDIGKGGGVAGHAERGADWARPYLVRLGVQESWHERILFIIEHHLEMARFWQRYDVDDPNTARRFEEIIGHADTLRLLYVHTFCDARGTSRDIWNSYKDMLHTQLFTNTLQLFGSQGAGPDTPTMISPDAIRPRLPQLTEEEVEAHFNLLPERYFLYTSEAEVVLHLDMVHRLLERIADAESVGSLVPVVEWQDDLDLSLTVVHVVTWDRAGLFFKLAGAFSVGGLSIVSSKALSRADHISIDTFYVTQNGGPVQDEAALETFQENLTAALVQGKDLLPAILAQAKKQAKPSYLRRETQLPADLPASVNVYHELALGRTIIEIQTSDRIGLLYRLARAIYERGFDISFARIATERNVAVDTFYIDRIDRNGDESTSELLALRQDLEQIITEPRETR